MSETGCPCCAGKTEFDWFNEACDGCAGAIFDGLYTSESHGHQISETQQAAVAAERDGRPCLRRSLKDYPCVKIEGHPGDHERFDGRTWPEGQTWGDVLDEYCRSQGIDPDDEEAYR